MHEMGKRKALPRTEAQASGKRRRRGIWARMLASALPLEQGSIGLDDWHRPGNLVPFRNGWNKFDLLNHKSTAINLIREYISLLGSGGTYPANILSAKRRSC